MILSPSLVQIKCLAKINVMFLNHADCFVDEVLKINIFGVVHLLRCVCSKVEPVGDQVGLLHDAGHIIVRFVHLHNHALS